MATRVHSEVLTFLIADVRGYSAFTQARGDEAAARLAEKFAELAREGVEAHGGDVIELRGDEALAVFRSARGAMRAAVDLQLVFADECLLDPSLPLSVGIGLDTGEAVPVEGGYRGGALNLAARLCSSAGGGEVLASQGVAHAARAFDGLTLVDRGTLQLKGFTEPVQVLRVLGAESTGASAIVSGGAPSELPAALDPVTPMIGRAQLARRLRWSWRMARRGHFEAMAIVGPAGIGKTRLAAEVAALAAADGAQIAYVSFTHGEPFGFSSAGTPALVVFDDLDAGRKDLVARVTAVVRDLLDTPTLVLLVYDDERADRDLVAAVRRIVGEEDVLRPGPLLPGEIRSIAALYVGAGVDSLPETVLSGSGVPRHVHARVAEWAQAETARRLGEFAAQAAAGRSDLRSVEASLADEVVELQAAREQALLFTAGAHADADTVGAPYPGLESFGVEDEARFFGREQLIADMVARLAGAPLLAIVGPSGSGKSSALRAGLLPALQSGALPTRKRWLVAVTRPGEHPLRELDRALWSSLPRDVVERIAGADLPLRGVREALGPDEGLIVAVDQFEELFTLCRSEDERRAYLDALVEAATHTTGNEVVVVALRADYYGQCSTEPRFAELLAANHVLVGPMSAEEYGRAITRPALGAGGRVDPALVDRLIAEVLGEPGALPLLSAALLELWQAREGRTITAASHARTGGVRGAVARLAEAAFARLDDEEQQVARSMLLRLAAEGDGNVPVRRRVRAADLDADRNPLVARVLEVLAADRLVTVGDGTVEVAHEALLREWPRFREWLADDRDGRRLHAHLSEAAQEWDRRERDDAELYRGLRLSAARDWAVRHDPELNSVEREFLEASRSEDERELRDQRRRNQRLRTLLAGALLLLVAALAAGAFALVARERAGAAATAATADRLGAQALTTRDLDTSLLLALEGVALEDTLQTRGNLEAALLRSLAATRVYRPLGDRLASVDVSPSGRYLLFGSPGGRFAVVDARTGRRVRLLVADAARFDDTGRVLAVRDVHVLAVDPGTGTRRAVGSLPGGTRVAALPRREGLVAVTTGSPDGHPLSVELVSPAQRRVTHVVYPPAGRTIVDVGLSDDGRVLIVEEAGAAGRATAFETWHVDPWRKGATIEDARSFSTGSAAAISHDDRRLVAGHPDGSVSIYALDPNGPRFDLRGRHNAAVAGARFSPDDATVITTGGDAGVLVWDARSGALREPLVGHSGGVLGTAFAPRGKTAYTAGLDGLGIAWDLSGRRRLSKPFAAGSGGSALGRPIVSFAVSPESRRVAVPDAGGLVRVLAVPSGAEFASLIEPPSIHATSVAWAADAELVAAAGPSNHVDVWRPVHGARQQSPVRIFTLSAAQQEPLAVALDAGGRVLAAGTAQGEIEVFSVRTGAASVKPLRAGAAVVQLQLSPDGRLLAACTARGTTLVWRLDDGKLLLRLGGDATSIGFSPDGSLLAVGAATGGVRLWQPQGEREGELLRGTAGAVLSVAFSPDGRQLVTGGADGTTRIFDVASRQQLGAPLPGLDNVPVGAAFTPDGTHVISLHATGRAFVFDLRIAEWRRHACAVAGRRLTAAEWQHFLPHRPFRPSC